MAASAATTDLLRSFLSALDAVPDIAVRADPVAEKMRALADRMEMHVVSRLPGSEPVVPNGAWRMMLDAAHLLRIAAGRRS